MIVPLARNNIFCVNIFQNIVFIAAFRYPYMYKTVKKGCQVLLKCSSLALQHAQICLTATYFVLEF